MVDSTVREDSEGQLLEDLSNRLEQTETGGNSLPVFREFFSSNLDLTLQAIGLARRDGWLELFPKDFSLNGDLPTVDDLSDGDLYERDGSIWFPVQDQMGFVGALILEQADQNKPAFDRLNGLAPPLLTYFRRLEHYESASNRAEFTFLSRELPVTRAEGSSGGLDEIFQSSVESIKRIFECDNCRLFWRESPEILKLKAESPSTDELATELIVSDDPVIQQVIDEGKSVIINDLPEAEESLQQASNIRSFLSVPIRVEGQVKGAINLSSQAPDVYTEDDLKRFAAFCDHLSSVYASTQELVDLTRYVDNVMSNLPVGVLNYQIQHDDINFNPRAREILKVDKEEISREHFENLFSDRLLQGEFLDLLNIDEDTVDVSQEKYELQDLEGNRRIVKASRSSIRDSENLLSGIVIVLSDITEQERLNEQVSRTERLAALGELASSLAHEIKNPLTSIQGFIQMMPERSEDQEFIEKTADILGRECNRLDELIKNLQSYARPQVGQRQEFNIKDVIDETLTLLRKEAEKEDVDINLRVNGDLKVYGDPSKLKQVVMNLSLNAIEAISEGGEYDVIGEEANHNYIRLRFEDNGIGMDEETLGKIFNPFFTTKDEGTGLGMAITHRIVEDHGGMININSTPKEGTEVEVLLPKKKSTPPLERSSVVG